MKNFTVKHILLVTTLAAGGFMLTACQDKGFDWNEAHKEANNKAELDYAEAFESYFGKIDPDQSWDFTKTKGTRAEAERLRATPTETARYCTIGSFYDVPTDFKDWLDVNMHESDDNRVKGSALNFTMPSDGKFDLIPMYQGEAVSSWEMHMIVSPKNGTPIDMNFWKRNDNIQIKQHKVTWGEQGVMTIKNDRSGKYLHVQTKERTISHTQNVEVTVPVTKDYYEFHPVKGDNDYDNQIYFHSTTGFTAGSIIQFAFRYKANKNSVVSFDFHKSIGSPEDVHPVDAHGLWVDDGKSSVLVELWGPDYGNLSSERFYDHYGWLSNVPEYDYAIFHFKVPQGASGYEWLCMNIDVPHSRTTEKYGKINSPDGGNVIRLMEISINQQGNAVLDLANSKSKMNGESDYTTLAKAVVNETQTQQQTVTTTFPASGTRTKSDGTTVEYTADAINPVVPFADYSHRTGKDPYKDSKEFGMCFLVVSIYHKNTNGNYVGGKYLYAFDDDPANPGGIVSVDGDAVIFIPIDDVDFTAKDAPHKNPKEVSCYNAPWCNLEPTERDVQFLMIGTKFLYVDDNGKLAAKDREDFQTNWKGSSEARQWNVDDSQREFLLNPANGYTWTYNSRKRYTYECYQMGCNGDGTPRTDIPAGDCTSNLYSKYDDSSNTLVWMNVKNDMRENSMNKIAVKGKRYQFDFSKELDTYKDASISFYWETMIPWKRRTDENGRYLYSDKPGQLQMLAITARQAPADGDRNVVAVGCEAGMAHIDRDTDWDYNDVVFLLSSEKPITYIDKEGENEIIQKRYMVEDLGNTGDIDFNDMVVDVIQTTTPIYKEGSDGSRVLKEKVTSQKVVVRAIGGTLPFEFFIGDTKIFSKFQLSGVNVNGMYNTGCGDGSTSADSHDGSGSQESKIDYNKSYGEYTIPDSVWDPEANNVMFRVYRKNTNYTGDNADDLTNAYYTHDITFPGLGETPHIIAFPIDKLWRNERRLCCWDWLNDQEPSLWEMPENKILSGSSGNEHYTNPHKTHTIYFSEWYNSHKTEYWGYVDKFEPNNGGETIKEKLEKWFVKVGIAK